MHLRSMHRLISAAILIALLGASAVAQRPAEPLPRLKVADNHHFLVTANGQPFFWLGDTAWELFHRLTREEAVQYFVLRVSASRSCRPWRWRNSTV